MSDFATIARTKDQTVIATLEEALRRAQAGEIVDVSIACIYSDGDLGYLVSATNDRPKQARACALLLSKIQKVST